MPSSLPQRRQVSLQDDSTLLENRQQAGLLLAEKLQFYRGNPDCVVVGLARGGIPVAQTLAAALHLPMDVCSVARIVYPYRPELVLGAVGPNILVVLSSDDIAELHIPDYQIDALADEQEAELLRREILYRRVRNRVALSGKTAILVDDTMRSGASMSVAIRTMRNLGAKQVITAVAIASHQALGSARKDTDGFFYLFAVARFPAKNYGFRDAHPLTDRQIQLLLEREGKGSSAESVPFADDWEHRKVAKLRFRLSPEGATPSEQGMARSR